MQEHSALIDPDGGETLLNLGTLVRIKVGSADTGGAFSVVEHIVPPQAGPPLHTHPETEVLYVLSGEFEIVAGAQHSRVGAGAVIHVRPHTPHRTRNVGSGAGRLLSVYSPGAADRFFIEAGTAVAAGDALPDLDRPADMSGVDVPHVMAIARRHGMHIVP